MVVIVGVYVVMSVVTLVVFGWDKRAAIKDRRRVPEARLHLLELLGGFPGSLAAQQLFRHKRRKRSFVAMTWLISIAHAAAWIGWSFWVANGD
ncbi:MAG: DUF1294 domain-containing protein [Planctomycetota bacterium]